MVNQREDRTKYENEELEKSILGGLILKPETMVSVSLILEDFDFSSRLHRVVYQHLIKLWDNRDSIDSTSLVDSMKNGGVIIGNGLQGMMMFVDRLLDNASTSTAIEKHAMRLKEYSRRKRTLEYGNWVIEQAASEDIEAAMGKVIEKAIDLNNLHSISIGEQMDVLMDRYITDYNARMEAQRLDENSKPFFYSTGINDLDEICSGFCCPLFVILAARPGVGKTALAVNFALSMAKQGGKVLFMSLEMSGYQLINRMVANETGLNSHYIKKGINQPDEDRFYGGCYRIKELPIVIDDRSKSLNRILNEMRRWSYVMDGVDLVVVDYLQDIMHMARTDRERIADITRQLKFISQELSTCVIALAQINREGDARPHMRDVLGSGQIEQAADLFMILHEPDKENVIDDRHRINVNVCKNREGRTGETDLDYMAKECRFTGALDFNSTADRPCRRTVNSTEEDDLDENYV